MSLNIDREFVLQVLEDLVRINSVNPALVEGAPGEQEIAAYTGGIMRDLRLDVQTVASRPERPSTLGWRRGRGRGRSLMLNAHYDTVGVEGMAEPFSPRVEDGRLYGRGSYDMKASLAACLGAVKALSDAGVELAGDLVVAAVADEEHASLGTRDVIEECDVDGAVVTEPSQLAICLAHKGFVWIDIETTGRAAHGSQYREGIDANVRMGRVLVELERLQQQFARSPGHPLLGPPSLHAAMINGGTAESVYAARCRLTVERRTIPGEREAQVAGELMQVLERLKAADPAFEASLRTTLARDPFEVAREACVVRTVADAAKDVLGAGPEFVGENPWMDSALLSAAGVETVVFGPSGAGAHGDVEWVDLESVYQVAEVLARTAVAYCGTRRDGANASR